MEKDFLYTPFVIQPLPPHLPVASTDVMDSQMDKYIDKDDDSISYLSSNDD
jgi:hypothetical protein